MTCWDSSSLHRLHSYYKPLSLASIYSIGSLYVTVFNRGISTMPVNPVFPSSVDIHCQIGIPYMAYIKSMSGRIGIPYMAYIKV